MDLILSLVDGRMALEIRVVLQSVNAVTKHAHTSGFHTLSRRHSALYCNARLATRVEEFDGRYGNLSCIHCHQTLPFISRSNRPILTDASHAVLWSESFIAFIRCVSWFISIDGGPFSYHCYLFALEPTKRSVFDEIALNRSGPA